ncbi:MAG: primary-amine oxidase [Actinomycetia bacterium]|nr:primary-amine oxidase [Actinomycetes bacterium]
MTVVDESGHVTALGAHYLDPLGAEEIRQAAAIVRAQHELADSAVFVTITLAEPSKEAIAEGDIEREAAIVTFDRAEGTVLEFLVSLDAERVRDSRRVDGVQPPFLVAEWEPFVEAVKADPRYREALARRGLTDLDLISIDPIPFGSWNEDASGRRLCRSTSFVRPRTPGGNRHARHVEGLVCVVDLQTMEVESVEDHGVVPLAPDVGEYEAASVGALRTDVRPLAIDQPEGASFEVAGWEVAWQKWRFRVGFNEREGLVLHDLRYEDGGRERSILQRASYTELAVTYADTSPGHWFMSFFDFGELQPGLLANSLSLGCDCLGLIHYFDVVLSNADGEPVELPNAVCLHEEDYGLLWKHADLDEQRAEVRRSRRLVISWIGTFGNYEYGFYWYFYQDGTIASEVKLTGILQTAVLQAGEQPISGVLVAPQVNGMSHQHVFNVRLDFDIDGPQNTVEEVWAEPRPSGPENPYGTAFVTRTRPLTRESEAKRRIDPLCARQWQIVNNGVTNVLGQPVAYRLVPGENVAPMVHPDSPYGRRAGFVEHHLHVTPYEPDERYAAGEYPYQHPGGAGLPEWTSADRPIANTDTVVWYTFGHHHVPRAEDWPVMPVAAIGFTLKPVGFFDRNPALDVPPPDPKHGRSCHEA